ncbi:MAG: PopZ family protein [Methylocystis sp.]|uniref:PopZ family protein n=1 Tax=Methylocystis sp. TaxID=1911079 RepID=UPI003DA40E9E
MSAANASAPSHSLQDEARANEPSMEEILASIRRIIADDESLPGARRDDRRRARDIDAARSAYPAPVLERREDEPPLSLIDDDLDGIEDARDVRLVYVAGDAPQETGPERTQAEESLEIERVVERQEPGIEICDVAPVRDRALLSDQSAATVASKFQALAAGVAFSESDILDRCAKEMLQPMLQQWLEANLPALVEQLVRAEIERLARPANRLAASARKSSQP